MFAITSRFPFLYFTFVPKPKTLEEIQQTRAKEIEDSAIDISGHIEACIKLRDTYNAQDLIYQFREVWGDTLQVKDWQATLIQQLRIKQKQIENNI